MPDETTYTVRDTINRLTEVNEIGVTNLADKGVTIESPVTTAKIMDGIGDIPKLGFNGSVSTVPVISAAISGFTATVEIQE